MRIAVLDIGGTAIKFGLYEDGRLKNVGETPTLAGEGGAAVVARACGALAGFGDFEAVGVSTAGQVNSETGCIIFANDNIPGYTGVQVRKLIEARFGVPAAVENDVNAAALGEYAFGAGQGSGCFLMATYGTGVGGAAVFDGALYHGSSFSAAEFGGLVMHPEAMREGEIFSGCYEHYASATALVRNVKACFPDCDNGRWIFERLDDPGVRALVDAWISEVAAGLVSLTHLFNPERIVLGGGVMAQPYAVDGVRRETLRHLSGGFGAVQIVGAALQNKAGLYGAAVLAQKRSSSLLQMP